ncbi:uncharacterized protein V6R79_019647 [Siganus canaliculatus]
MTLRSSLLLSVLFWAGSTLSCDWDQYTNRSLELASLDAALLLEDQAAKEASDPDGCQAACCSRSDCDLALVGYPADGGPQCLLVRCRDQNRDACLFRPGEDPQFSVYRKKTDPQTDAEAPKDGDSPHIAPLGEFSELKTNETNNVRCRLPMKVGSCRASFPRFYYDSTNQSCRRFIYGGCEANGNNFLSQDECEATCRGVTGPVLPDESTPAPPVKSPRRAPPAGEGPTEGPGEGPAEGPAEGPTPEPGTILQTEKSSEDVAERCGAEPEMGPCRAMFQRWFYNRETGMCQNFIYGGCRGNKNNYDSKESCMAACTASALPSSQKSSSDEVPSDHDVECMVAPDPGPCRAAFTMFYYDAESDSCPSFIYGGCRGNKNRYSSAEACMNRCGIIACPRDLGSHRNRWTSAAFLFITLAAISALVLATLIVITMRRRRLVRRPSSVSDKEELLPDEQASVESLSIPDSPKPYKA